MKDFESVLTKLDLKNLRNYCDGNKYKYKL